MSKKYLERAAREGRVAVQPEWLQEGRTVWIWRSILCDEELCPDSVGSACPLNGKAYPWSLEARKCARTHPVLDKLDVWSVAAHFEPRGLTWAINDEIIIPDACLREAVWPSERAAKAHRPEAIRYG